MLRKGGNERLMWIDAVEKLKYYKERIMQELTSMGVYPDAIAVQEQLEDYDAELSIFAHRYAVAGAEFDVDNFNKEFAAIAEDLRIIYKLVNELAIKRYEEVKEYAETHLAELRAMAQKYNVKTKFEIDSTSLGETVFFQASGFDTTIDNSTAKIALGNIEVHKGAQLACIFDAEDVKQENVVFTIGGNNCSPYELNHDLLKIPGEMTKNIYHYVVPEGEVINSAHALNVENFTPSTDNSYLIYGGHNMVAGRYDYHEKFEDTPLEFGGQGRVSFWVLDGTFINFTFSNAPKTSNFNGTSITKMKKHHKIVMEYDKGFSFDFVTDGTVYATRSQGIISDGKLYYPNGDNVRDYYIEEYTANSKVTFSDAVVTISGLKENKPLTINTIAVKETLTMDNLED